MPIGRSIQRDQMLSLRKGASKKHLVSILKIVWGESVIGMNQEKFPVHSISQACSASFHPCDCLEPEKTMFPKISIFEFTAKIPWNSGSVKRVVNQTRKRPFSNSDEIRSIELINNRSGSSVSSSSRIEMHVIFRVSGILLMLSLAHIIKSSGLGWKLLSNKYHMHLPVLLFVYLLILLLLGPLHTWQLFHTG